MPTSNAAIPFEQMLAHGGQAREVLRGAWGHWADEFCDGLLARRSLEDVVHIAGAHFISYGKGQRLAVRWTADRGWTYYDCIEDAMNERVK